MRLQMRLMQIATNFNPGGIQRHVLDLTAALRGMGHHVGLAGDEGGWGRFAGADRVPLGLTAVTERGGSLPRRLTRLPPLAWQLRRALASQRIELIHAHETAPALVARLATMGHRLPIIMTYHGAAPEREAEVARIAGLCADLVISPSRTSLDRLIERGLDAKRTRVIGLGVPPPAAGPEAAVAARRQELLAGAAGPLVVSLSRLSEQKGLDDMIAVAAAIIARHPGAVFAVGGGGPLADTVAEWARASGLGPQFRLLGPVSDVAVFLAAADLYLLTSRWENLPISIVEAFRAGLPVVATDCGGVRELVDEAVGALCPVGDVAAIVSAVDGILSDPARRNAAGAAALERSAESRFDPETVHRQFAAMYDEILAQTH